VQTDPPGYLDIVAEALGSPPGSRATQALLQLARGLRTAAARAGVPARVSGDVGGDAVPAGGRRIVVALRSGQYPAAPPHPCVQHPFMPRQESLALARVVSRHLTAATGWPWPPVLLWGALAVARRSGGSAPAPAVAVYVGTDASQLGIRVGAIQAGLLSAILEALGAAPAPEQPREEPAEASAPAAGVPGTPVAEPVPNVQRPEAPSAVAGTRIATADAQAAGGAAAIAGVAPRGAPEAPSATDTGAAVPHVGGTRGAVGVAEIQTPAGPEPAAPGARAVPAATEPSTPTAAAPAGTPNAEAVPTAPAREGPSRVGGVRVAMGVADIQTPAGSEPAAPGARTVSTVPAPDTPAGPTPPVPPPARPEPRPAAMPSGGTSRRRDRSVAGARTLPTTPPDGGVAKPPVAPVPDAPAPEVSTPPAPAAGHGGAPASDAGAPPEASGRRPRGAHRGQAGAEPVVAARDPTRGHSRTLEHSHPDVPTEAAERAGDAGPETTAGTPAPEPGRGDDAG